MGPSFRPADMSSDIKTTPRSSAPKMILPIMILPNFPRDAPVIRRYVGRKERKEMQK